MEINLETMKFQVYVQRFMFKSFKTIPQLWNQLKTFETQIIQMIWFSAFKSKQ